MGYRGLEEDQPHDGTQDPTRRPTFSSSPYHIYRDHCNAFIFANARFTWFEDIVDLLGDIGSIERTRELSLAGTDQLFVTRWTCLPLLAIRQILDTDWKMWNCADQVLNLLTKDDDTGEDHEALTGAQTIDKNFRTAKQCLYNLSYALSWTENPTEGKAILRDHESVISELERIRTDAGRLENVDQWILETQSAIAPQLTSHFPGILDDLHTALVREWRLASVSNEIDSAQRLTLTKTNTPGSNSETGREVDDAAGRNKDGVRFK